MGSLWQPTHRRLPAQTGGSAATVHGFVDAADFGFSPAASGLENTKALQRAVDQGGTIVVSRPGTYQNRRHGLSVGGDTSLVFGNGVFLKKVAERARSPMCC